MRNKKIWFLIFICLLSYFAKDFISFDTLPKEDLYYPNFYDNPQLDVRMRKLMQPYLLPQNHPAKPVLDLLFSQGRVIENGQTLMNAGFNIITSSTGSYVVVARHPAVPGYIFKIYLDSETRNKDGIPNWEWLTRRCRGAQILKTEVKKKNIQNFIVPDKWLYVLPPCPRANAQPVIVIATDMQVEDREASRAAWKTLATKKHLDELYSVLKQGYGDVELDANIPYTRMGKFAFTDTEYPYRRHKLRKAKIYFSDEMQAYWTKISKCKEKKVKQKKSNV